MPAIGGNTRAMMGVRKAPGVRSVLTKCVQEEQTRVKSEGRF